MKTIPKRMCISCRTLYDKSALMRIVCTQDGDISLDVTGKKSGRGAYICTNPACMEKCIKGKLLNKTFKVFVGQETYDKLQKEYESIKQ